MSLAIWPPVSPEELKLKEAESQKLELQWMMKEIIHVCQDVKHGLDDCYALLAPIDPGSTLVMSTHRNEKVKGTLTRVGTRIVKGSLNVQLRMSPLQSISIDPSHPIHMPELTTLHSQITSSIDLLTSLLSQTSSLPDPDSLSSTLQLLSSFVSASTELLKGKPPSSPDTGWTISSCPPSHFSSPSVGPPLSFHLSLQDCCVVLWLRVLEPANSPVHFGTKLGLAIGTVRRLEHDEMDVAFEWDPKGTGLTEMAGEHEAVKKLAATEHVYVREKVRIESADPSLISVFSKLGYLNHVLGQARQNLAAVMGSDLKD